MEKLAERGQLPEHPWAVEALELAMRALRSPVAPRDKIASARLILDFAQPRPGANSAPTMQSAEDLLAALLN